MKYQALPSFRADFRRLTEGERELFSSTIHDINVAFTDRGDRPLPEWPGHLRVKPVRGAIGVFELTWSYRRPDGRATFEFIEIDGEPAIRWRRIGDHRIFESP